MHPTHADLLAIGFGKGGKTLPAAMGWQGKPVVMAEQSAEMYGGTCINIGSAISAALSGVPGWRRQRRARFDLQTEQAG